MDGKPCDGKLSRTVWGGGKLGDDIKELPIVKSVYPTGNCGGGTHTPTVWNGFMRKTGSGKQLYAMDIRR